MRHLLILASLLFGAGAMADEADFDFSSLGVKKALRDYKKAVAKDEKAQAQKQKELDEAGAKAAKKTRDAFAERLKKALKQARQAGNLEKANKIDAAIKALKKGSPAGGSAANRKEQANREAEEEAERKAKEEAERKAKEETERTTKVTHWPNGQKKSEAHYKNGKRHGSWSEFGTDGVLLSKRQYKNGKLTGGVVEGLKYDLRGKSKNEIKKIFGRPPDGTGDSNSWRYYGKFYDHNAEMYFGEITLLFKNDGTCFTPSFYQ